MPILIFFAILLFSAPESRAAQHNVVPDLLELSSNLQMTWRQSVHQKNPLAAILRLQLDAKINKNSWIRGFVSGYADADFSVPGRPDSQEQIVTPEISEAHLTLDSRYVDVIAGLQQIRWGEADTLSSFDIINPVDFRNPISTARSSRRLSVGALDIRISLGGMGLLDAVVIPVPRFSRLPEKGSPWEGRSLQQLREIVESDFVHKENDKGPFDPELAARFKIFRPGYDIALLFYRGYEHKPLYTSNIDRQSMSTVIRKSHEIYSAYGINTAVSLWDSTFRGEFTIKVDYPFQSGNLTGVGIERRTEYCSILGWDRNFLTNLSINLQTFLFAHDGEKISGKDRNRYGVSWSVSDKFLDEAMTAGIRGEYFANNQDACIEFFANYEYDDHITFSAGYMMFDGSPKNDLGQYDKNDHFYTGIRYSF